MEQISLNLAELHDQTAQQNGHFHQRLLAVEQAVGRLGSEQEAQQYDLDSKCGNLAFRISKVGSLTHNYLNDIIAIGEDVK